MSRNSSSSGLSHTRPLPRNDVGATFVLVTGHGHIEDIVQGVNLALNAAALIEIDEGIRGGEENIAGDDHVRLPENHQTISVRTRFAG